MGAFKRSGIEAAEMGAAPHLAADQPGMLQRLDVLGGRGERDGEGFRKLADSSLAAGQVAKHLPARGIAEGMKDGTQLRQIFNHTVEYSVRSWIVNRFVEYRSASLRAEFPFSAVQMVMSPVTS